MKGEVEMTHFVAETFKISSFKNLGIGDKTLVHLEIQSGSDICYLTVTIAQIHALSTLLQKYEPQVIVRCNTTQNMSYDIQWSSSDTVLIKCTSHETCRIIELSSILAKKLASAINSAKFNGV